MEEIDFLAEEESAASLLIGEAEAVPYGDDPLEEALPGSVDARWLEMSGAREARLSAEADRLQRELVHSAEKSRVEREVEGKYLRETAARTELELRAALARERELRARHEAELRSAVDALAADHKRLKAVNVLLEQEAAGAKSSLTAFAAAAGHQSKGLAEQNEELGTKLLLLLERLKEIEKAHHEKVAALESEASRRLAELGVQEQLVHQAHETIAAESRRAEDAERVVRGLEKQLHDADGEAVRRLEPHHRAQTAEKVKEAVDAAVMDAKRLSDERLERLREHLTEAHQKAADLAVKQAVAEQTAASAKALAELKDAHQRELREALRAARAEAEAAVRPEINAAAANARKEADAAKDREVFALREKLLLEKASVHEQAAHARADAERRFQEEALHRLGVAQDEWRRQADAEQATLRVRLGAEREKAVADLRLQKEGELAAYKVQAEKERERTEADAYKKAKREAEVEMAGRVDKMGGEWQRLKGKFEEELARIREEMKRRERAWEDRVAVAEREAIRVKEEARIPMIRLEKELLAGAEERSKLSGDRHTLEEQLRKAAEDSAAAAARWEVEHKAAADQLKADKDAHTHEVAELKKGFEEKLKVIEGQLREERKKTVELLARAQEKKPEKKGLWGVGLMSFDPEFLDIPQPPEPAPGEAHLRFVSELDWHLSEMEELRAKLGAVRNEAERRLEVELSALRSQHVGELAVALETQRAQLDASLRRAIAVEIEARISEEYLERLKASQEAREKAAENERAYLKERFDAELAQAVAETARRAARDAEIAQRSTNDKALDEALAAAAQKAQAEREAQAGRNARVVEDLEKRIETLNRDIGDLQARRIQEAAAAEATTGRSLAEQKAVLDRRVEAETAQLKAAHAKRVAELEAALESQAKRHDESAGREIAELKKAFEKEKALITTQKDLESAQNRRELETSHQAAALDLRKKIQEEAQTELQHRTERMKQEWDKLRVRFDEELNKVRAEMKRRESVWEEKLKLAETEGAAKAIEMRAKLLNLEDAAARLEREKQAAVTETGELRLKGDKDSAELAGLKVETGAAIKKLSEDKAGLEAKLVDTKKELEAKVKAIEVQLREERKKNVEWEQKVKTMEARGVWERLKGP